MTDRVILDFRTSEGRSEAKRAKDIHWQNKATAERTLDERGNLAGVMQSAADLAALGDRLGRVRIEADRDADAMRARMAANQVKYFKRKDESISR